MTHRLSLDRIAEAARIIDPVFLASPQFVAEPLSEQLGARVVVKAETLNPVRCFKGRGADYYAATLPVDAAVVTASSGNLGQALVYACRRRNAHLTVFAATSANPFKLQRMRALGADVRLVGEDFDTAKIAARRFATDAGKPFVEDGVATRLSEGAGSIAVELLAFPERFDTGTGVSWQRRDPGRNGTLASRACARRRGDRCCARRCALHGPQLSTRPTRCDRQRRHHRGRHGDARSGSAGAGRSARHGGRCRIGGRYDNVTGHAPGPPPSRPGAGTLRRSRNSRHC